LRLRYVEPARKFSGQVLEIQKHLQHHPDLGFTWKPDIQVESGIVISVKDAEFETLSTDRWGFVNPPEAIEARVAGRRVHVAGLGDSFVEHAADVFFEKFREAGLSYYNLAIHRQSSPQYNVILESIALELEPNWVVYGLYENDFAEAVDYENWRRSGLDWFAYHSGIWCGPPLAATSWGRIRDRYLAGYSGAARAVGRRLGYGGA